MQIIENISADAASMSALRRQIHAHPELFFAEERTAELIAATLEGWGITVHRGLAKTGVVGVIRRGDSTRAVGLRADMDALPISEHNRFAHASRNPGRMHACGHDGHIAMLLAAGKHLAAHGSFNGTVYLIFQPAEERGAGAREMINDGLFERFPMDAIFGAHNWPGLDAGQFALSPGPIFASSNEFKVVVRGRGAHAALPHEGCDPVPVACQLVQAFQTVVTRDKRPIDAAVISVTMIHAGEATNVIPERCELRGTVRTFSLEVLELIERRMEAIAHATCAAFQCTCEFEFERNYPPLFNHARETAFARTLLAEIAGAENVLAFEPTMGAEDFSFYMQAKPGCYFLIGNGDGSHRADSHGGGSCMLHSSSYDFNDQLIPIGASAWARLAEAWLAAADHG